MAEFQIYNQRLASAFHFYQQQKAKLYERLGIKKVLTFAKTSNPKFAVKIAR